MPRLESRVNCVWRSAYASKAEPNFPRASVTEPAKFASRFRVILLIFLRYGQIDEVVVPFSRIDLLALLIDDRRNDHLYHGNVVAGYGLRGQTTVRHLGDKDFERAIVDVGQRQISDIWVDPFFEAALPQFQCCRCNWFALTTLDVVQPPFCLFAECDTLGLLYYLSKCSKVSAPLSATISRARRSLSDLDR